MIELISSRVLKLADPSSRSRLAASYGFHPFHPFHPATYVVSNEATLCTKKCIEAHKQQYIILLH